MTGQTTGISVLDNGYRRCGKISYCPPGGVCIQDVIEGKLLASKLFCPGDTGVSFYTYTLLGIEGG